MRQLLTDIAKRELGIPTLEMRGSDSLDFHDIGVGSLAEALALAYKAGQKVGLSPAQADPSEGYMVRFHARAGIYRDVIVADTPEQALAIARARAANPGFKTEDFEGDDDTNRIQQIIVDDQEGNERALWTDPNSIAQLHADEILHELEELIDAVDDMAETRGNLDDRISNVELSATATARVLKNLGLKGGVQ